MARGAKVAGALVAASLLAVAGYFVFVAQPALQQAAPAASAPGAGGVAGECSTVLKCAAPRSLREASEACKEPIAQLAVFQPRWIHGAGEPIFTDYAWLVEAQGSIRYFGNRAEFGNASGGFSPVNYECDYDPAGRKVIDVRVRGGA